VIRAALGLDEQQRVPNGILAVLLHTSLASFVENRYPRLFMSDLWPYYRYHVSSQYLHSIPLGSTLV